MAFARYVSILLLWAQVTLAQTPGPATARVDSFVRTTMDRLCVPGLAVAVVHRGNIVLLRTYGVANREWNTPVTAHTNFQIASCTKLLTSTLLLKALYERRLSLDDSVSRYVDSIPAAWRGLTVRHLMNHSSGLRAFAGDPNTPTAAVVRALRDSTLAYPTGTRQAYAQHDFMLAGYLLEQRYGKPFPTLLADEVTKPLGMTDGGFDFETAVGSYRRTGLIPQRATTYYEGDQGQTYGYKFLYPQHTYTAGGYYASISDLARWAVGLDRDQLFPWRFAEPLALGRDRVGDSLSEFTRVGWIYEKAGSTAYAGHSGGPGLGDIWRFPADSYTCIVLSNDGELLPRLARIIAGFYMPSLGPALPPEKYSRP